MKNFFKAVDIEREGFKYLRQAFPKLREAKFKEGKFNGAQIRKLLIDENFDIKLYNIEIAV